MLFLAAQERLKSTLEAKALLFEEAISRFSVPDRVELLIFTIVFF